MTGLASQRWPTWSRAARHPSYLRPNCPKLGFAIGIHPALGFLAVGAALKSAYGELLETGDVAGAQLDNFGEFSKLMGFEDVWEFDRKWAEV